MGSRYVALYDGQCEICQACVAWLQVLDRRGRVAAVPLETADLASLHPELKLEECLQELHVVEPGGTIRKGWEGVARLARLFPATWLIGAAGWVPPFRSVGQACYRFVARNRYLLSKCRGGACHVARPAEVRRRSALGAFWSCYSLGLVIRLPLVAWQGLRTLGKNLGRFLRTRHRRVDLLDGKLRLLFLGGFPSEMVPILFGEQFWAIVYDSVAVDPGSTRMRRSLRRHIRRLPLASIRAIVATHHHEEHTGNLNWLAEQTGAPIHVPAETVKILQGGLRLPPVRAMMIGDPPRLLPPFELLGDRLATEHGELEVLPAPGHCHDHVVLYDRREKLLLAGDAFMGAYFSAPNPDVDSQRWIETLERLLSLEIETLIEGHGLIYTTRPDIPDVPGVVVRQHPRVEMEKKLAYLRWLRGQIEAGLAEGLPLRAIEATCFPWGQAHSWETALNDELMRTLSLGHWSRTELVRSFTRQPDSRDILPTVYEARFYRGES